MADNIERKCGNCLLFDRKDSICQVTFIMDGEDYVLATKPEDDCHLEKHSVLQDVQTAGVWSNGKDGYVEY
jgi:hypothetical protein